jgi:hypothetical protein
LDFAYARKEFSSWTFPGGQPNAVPLQAEIKIPSFYSKLGSKMADVSILFLILIGNH